MTRRRAQRRLRRYADDPLGPTWRDLDDTPRYDGPARPPVPRPPYEQMPQRPAIPPPRKDAA